MLYVRLEVEEEVWKCSQCGPGKKFEFRDSKFGKNSFRQYSLQRSARLSYILPDNALQHTTLSNKLLEYQMAYGIGTITLILSGRGFDI